jgi:hypothetical protein
VGQALEEGLRDRILGWIKGEKGKTTTAVRRKPIVFEAKEAGHPASS